MDFISNTPESLGWVNECSKITMGFADEKSTPLQGYTSEIKTCAISSSFCRPSLIAVVCGMSKPVNYFKALAGEVLGLRLYGSCWGVSES